MTDTSELKNSTEIESGEISILDLIVALASRKRLLVGFPLLVALIAAGYSLTLPNVFTATTTILPPQQGGGASAVLAQLAGGVGASLGGTLKSPSDIYVVMLKSRTISDKIVDRYGLMKICNVSKPGEARGRFEESRRVTVGRESAINIEVDDTDPKRAAELANGLVGELYKLSRTLAVTEAAQRRLFFEQQLKLARDNLTNAEVEARQQLAKGGLVKVDDQGRSMVATTSQWRAKISAQEVHISAMRFFSTDNNPELILAQKELAAMREGLTKLESGEPKGQAPSGKGMDSLSVLRNVKYYETLYELLAKQYEAARMDESKDSSLIQVLDVAVEPEFKSKPKRSVTVIISAVVALFLAICWILGVFLLTRAQKNPEQARRLVALRDELLKR